MKRIISRENRMNIRKYNAERRLFIKMGGEISSNYRILNQFSEQSGTASGHYFHQDLLVAQFIFSRNPLVHVDIGSRIDGFVAHVASFRKIFIYDIRPLKVLNHPNIEYAHADLMLGIDQNFADSISCLHSIEHFGLGRYGDPINPQGHIIAFTNLIKMLKQKGILYLSIPIGPSDEVLFNAHRIFHPQSVLSWTNNKVKLLRFDYVDDNGDLHKNFDIRNVDSNIKYGCGIYTFEKL
jgi:hypothetical protein